MNEDSYSAQHIDPSLSLQPDVEAVIQQYCGYIQERQSILEEAFQDLLTTLEDIFPEQFKDEISTLADNFGRRLENMDCTFRPDDYDY